MARQWIAAGLAMMGLGCLPTVAIAQIGMTNGTLNLRMRQALCRQDWGTAVRVIDQMKKATPFYREELNYYRARLVILRNQNASIDDWPSASYCTGNLETFPNGDEDKPNNAETTPTLDAPAATETLPPPPQI